MKVKSIAALVLSTSLAITMAVYLPVQAQSDLKEKINDIFLHLHNERQDGVRAKVVALGRKAEVEKILLEMTAKNKYAQVLKEKMLLNGAVSMLGDLRVEQATGLFSQMLFDNKVNAYTRALAATSLGKVDAEGSKQLLLKALDPSVSDYPVLRINAAEALSKVKDRQVLEALERCSREEQDRFTRQKFENAAQDVRKRVERKSIYPLVR